MGVSFRGTVVVAILILAERPNGGASAAASRAQRGEAVRCMRGLGGLYLSQGQLSIEENATLLFDLVDPHFFMGF